MFIPLYPHCVPPPFHEQLKALLKRKHLTQVQLAEALKVEPEWVNRLANGHEQPCKEMVSKIICILHVTTYESFALYAGAGYLLLPWDPRDCKLINLCDASPENRPALHNEIWNQKFFE